MRGTGKDPRIRATFDGSNPEQGGFYESAILLRFIMNFTMSGVAVTF